MIFFTVEIHGAVLSLIIPCGAKARTCSSPWSASDAGAEVFGRFDPDKTGFASETGAVAAIVADHKSLTPQAI
jgi:hypothetical protein